MGWTFYNSSGQQLRNTGTVLATQAEMEAGTALTSFVTPGRSAFHPGSAKAWCMIEQNGTLSGTSYPDVFNIDSVTDTGTGDRTVVWDTDFSSADYVMLSTAAGGISQYHVNVPAAALASWAVGSLQMTVCRDTNYNGTPTAIDEAHCVVAFGDQ